MTSLTPVRHRFWAVCGTRKHLDRIRAAEPTRRRPAPCQLPNSPTVAGRRSSGVSVCALWPGEEEASAGQEARAASCARGCSSHKPQWADWVPLAASPWPQRCLDQLSRVRCLMSGATEARARVSASCVPCSRAQLPATACGAMGPSARSSHCHGDPVDVEVGALRNGFTYGKLFHQWEIVSELLRYL